MSFAKEIWDKFSNMDVNVHTEKRGQFTFLSWTWAWDALMREYPESTYDYDDAIFVGDTLEVRVSITVKSGEDELTRSMWLPVMDYKNNAIPNPTSRDVSDARMRCLVKCLAMFGLGHYIYAGQDLPSKPEKPKKPAAKPATDEQFTQINAYVKKGQIPARTLAWCKDEKNWNGMTSKQADNIINICKQEGDK